MADDSPEELPPSPDPARAKRAPPTIDLEASEVSGETRKAAAEPEPELGPEAERPAQESQEEPPEQPPREPPKGPAKQRSLGAISFGLIAALTGAVAAALVIALFGWAGWPGAALPPPPAPVPQADTSAIDALTSRVGAVEARTAKSGASAPDPAVAARIDALEKSVAALRGEMASAHAQSDKLAAAVDDLKSAPRESASSTDLGPINDRLAQLERVDRAQSAEIAQATAKPADDPPLRRIVAAALLDVLVRSGDPYPAALAAAKALAPDPAVLKPLDPFAESGVPTAAMLSRELLTLVPKLQPPVEETSTAGAGVVERLQAGAVKLMRIERTDAVGNDRGAIVSRVTAAALRNDSNEARHELNTLAPADRAAAQSWIDKADARDAALAASRQFAADAMTALAKPAP
jgi:hypothetical protein